MIFITAVFTFYQDVESTRVLGSFKKFIPAHCLVMREGKPLQIHTSHLAVGDIVVVESGGIVPADMRIISATNLKIDKSNLTGENEPIRLTSAAMDPSVNFLESRNIAFLGCNVVEGEGTGVVIATGKNNQLAKIASQISTTEVRTSSLQAEINRAIAIIGGIAFVTMAVVIAEWAGYLNIQHPGFMTVSSMIANAISVLVAYVPEGLPVALSVSLILIARRLCLVYSVLVKNLLTIESLGSMSFLASDKTGTLTENKMTVVAMLLASGPLVAESLEKDHSLFSKLARASVLCNQSRVEVKYEDEDGGEPEAGRVISRSVVGGNGVDKALLQWAEGQGFVDDMLRSHAIKCTVPFNSASKVMFVVAQPNEGEHVVIMKGAPEYVLSRCSNYYDESGATKPLNSAVVSSIRSMIDRAASLGQRVIAIAELSLPKQRFCDAFEFSDDPYPNFPVTDLTFLSCVAIADPPRAGVKEAVGHLRNAGIKIAMVTGDASNTALAIARQVGIVRDSDSVDEFKQFRQMQATNSSLAAGGHHNEAIVVEGKDLYDVSDKEWEFIFQHSEFVFARTTPEQKLLIVKEIQARDYRVGVTGDGVNDSPALRRSDVGMAMNSGSSVARDAADIVLLNDDFTAIVRGVEEGRLLFSNIRKVIGYCTSAGNWCELLPVLATFFVGIPQPLSSFLMIIICCFTDLYADIALSFEPPETFVMLEPPRDLKKKRLLDVKILAYSFLFYGSMMTIGTFYTYFHYMAHRGPLGGVPTPVPSDDDGRRSFPAGYSASQLVGAWNWGADSGNLGTDETNAANTASSVYFVCLAVGQMGHLISIRRKVPYFYSAIVEGKGEGNVFQRIWQELLQSPPRVPIVIAMVLSVLTINFFNEIPILQQTCGTGSVPALYWGMAFGWSLVYFIVAEIRKWIIVLYPNSWIAKTDW